MHIYWLILHLSSGGDGAHVVLQDQEGHQVEVLGDQAHVQVDQLEVEEMGEHAAEEQVQDGVALPLEGGGVGLGLLVVVDCAWYMLASSFDLPLLQHTGLCSVPYGDIILVNHRYL